MESGEGGEEVNTMNFKFALSNHSFDTWTLPHTEFVGVEWRMQSSEWSVKGSNQVLN